MATTAQGRRSIIFTAKGQLRVPYRSIRSQFNTSLNAEPERMGVGVFPVYKDQERGRGRTEACKVGKLAFMFARDQPNEK